MLNRPPNSAPLLGEPLPVELMNTLWYDREGIHDALSSPDATRAWLNAVAPRLPLVPIEVTEVDELLAERLSGLRNALRRLAAEQTEDDRPKAASVVADRRLALLELNRACAAAPSWSGLEWADGQEPGRAIHSAGRPGPAVVSLLAEEAVALFSGATRTQLRACPAPACVLYFIRDHPRREWCSAGCGNRARVARHYQRHHGTSAQTDH